MKILFDTNIFIDLETPGRVLPNTLSEMVSLTHKLRHVIYYHPAQFEDLRRDKDETRREAQLSRLLQYVPLESPPLPSDSDIKSLGWTQARENDHVDNALLFAVYRNAVRILVTEDRGIHKKADRNGLANRVFFVEEYLSYLRNSIREETGSAPSKCVAVETKFLYQIDVKNQFFDSLRLSYQRFDRWYAEVSGKDRQCWVIESEDVIRALCIYKHEKDEVVTSDDIILHGKLLKLCTFKVSDLGKKYGERLLYVAFCHAMESLCDFVYVHLKEIGHGYLLSLLSDFGFYKIGEYKNGDSTFVKDMRVGVKKLFLNREEYVDYAIRYYPHINDNGVRKYIVPIQPVYHDRLFPDVNPCPSLFKEELASESNAIKKAYLCKSPLKSMLPGDLLFFYRSEDQKHIISVGVLEKIGRFTNAEDLIAFVSKRSVYTNAEIAKMAAKGEVLAILFRLIRYLKSPIKKKTLTDNGVKGQIQTIREMPEKVYHELFQKDVGI